MPPFPRSAPPGTVRLDDWTNSPFDLAFWLAAQERDRAARILQGAWHRRADLLSAAFTDIDTLSRLIGRPLGSLAELVGTLADPRRTVVLLDEASPPSGRGAAGIRPSSLHRGSYGCGAVLERDGRRLGGNDLDWTRIVAQGGAFVLLDAFNIHLSAALNLEHPAGGTMGGAHGPDAQGVLCVARVLRRLVAAWLADPARRYEARGAEARRGRTCAVP